MGASLRKLIATTLAFVLAVSVLPAPVLVYAESLMTDAAPEEASQLQGENDSESQEDKADADADVGTQLDADTKQSAPDNQSDSSTQGDSESSIPAAAAEEPEASEVTEPRAAESETLLKDESGSERQDDKAVISTPELTLDNQSDSSIWDGSTAASFAGGSGTSEDPYLISNASELAYLIDFVKDEKKNKNKYYSITNDIFLNDTSNYTSWGNENAPKNVWAGIDNFSGTLNGNGHVIHGMYVNSSQDCAGFINNALQDHDRIMSIESLHFDALYVYGPYAGGIVGEMCWGKSSIIDCSVRGQVKGISGAAGMVYYAVCCASFVMRGCTNYASVSSYYGAGGLVDYLGDTSSISITQCKNTGEIIGKYDVGGIAGSITLEFNQDPEISQLENEGNVTGECAGGVIGRYKSLIAFPAGSREFISMKIDQCSNSGEIKAVDAGTKYGVAAGGICGQWYQDSGSPSRNKMSNSYNTGRVSGPLYDTAGIAGRASGVGFDNCYNSGQVVVASESVRTYPIYGTRVAGIYTSITPTVENCHYLAGSASSTHGATAFSAEDMYNPSTFPTFDFSLVWKLCADHPKFRWQSGQDIGKYPHESEPALDPFTQEHVDFVNSNTFTERMNNGWAKIISTGLDSTTGRMGEVLYDVFNDVDSLISGRVSKVSFFDNPYDPIIADLILAQAKLKQADFDFKWENKLVGYVSDLEGICKEIDRDSWENPEYKMYLERLIEAPEEYAKENPAFYKLCQSTFGNIASTPRFNNLVNAFGKADDLIGVWNAGRNSVEWVAHCLQYNALVSAYLETSDEFKQSLRDAVGYMALNASGDNFLSRGQYGLLYEDACGKFAKFQTTDQVKTLLFEEYLKDGATRLEDVFGETIVNNTVSYVAVGLGISEAAAPWVFSAIAAYKVGWGISEAITDNGTNMDCRKLARAYYYLEDAMLWEVEDDASNLRGEQTYERAAKFDASYMMLRDLECGALGNYIKYLNAQQCSGLQGVLHGFRKFNEPEICIAEAMRAEWELAHCHSGAQSSQAISSYGMIKVCCPTDVFVCDKSSNVVFSIEDGKVTNRTEGIEGCAVGGVKMLVIPNPSDYRIGVTATDNGSMSYQASTYNPDGSLTNTAIYKDVEFSKDDTFTGHVAENNIDLTKNDVALEQTGGADDFISVESIELGQSDVSLEVGEKFAVTAIVSPSSVSFPELLWSTSDEGVATVDENGTITGRSEGTCTVQCSTLDNSQEYATVEVKISKPALSSGGKVEPPDQPTEGGGVSANPTRPDDSEMPEVSGSEEGLPAVTPSGQDSTADTSGGHEPESAVAGMPDKGKTMPNDKKAGEAGGSIEVTTATGPSVSESMKAADKPSEDPAKAQTGAERVDTSDRSTPTLYAALALAMIAVLCAAYAAFMRRKRS